MALAFLTALATAGPAVAAASPQPALVGSVSNATSLSGAIGVAVSGHYAFTTAYWPGQLTVVDISNPAAPTVVGSTSTNATQLENGSTVTISGTYAFVVSKNRNASTTSNDDGSGNSLTIVNVANPASPTVVGTVQSSTQLFGAYGVAVQGNYAYVAYQGELPGQPQAPDTRTGGLSVINITNPAGPTIVANIDNGSLPAPYTGTNALDHATSVAISGHYVYVTAFYGDRLTVVDISNPTGPSIVYSLPDANRLASSNYIAVSGSYAYIAAQTGQGHFQLTDVSLANPAKPTIVGTLSDPALLNGAYRLRVRGSLAYIAANNVSTVAAIDISSPAAPRLVASVTDTAHLHRTSDLDLDSSGRYLVATSPDPSGVSQSLYPPFTNTTGTISVIDLIPNPIAVPISSGPAKSTKASSAGFAFAASDTVSALACRLDTGAYGACTSPTSQTYSGLLPGRHTFTVRATDAAGNTASSSYTWAIDAAPKAVKGPSPSAGTVVGLAIHAQGTWTGYPAIKFHYQWLRCNRHARHCQAIRGATHSAYTPAAKDLGTRLEVRVTASNSLGTAKKTSSASPTVGVAVKAKLVIKSGHARLILTVADPVPKAALTRITFSLARGVKINGKSKITVTVHGKHRKLKLTYSLSGSVTFQTGVSLKYTVVDSSGAHIRAPLLVY